MRVTQKKWVVCVMVVGLCLVTAAAQAQQQGRRGNRGGGPGGFGRGGFGGAGFRMMFLQNEQVQKELELIDDQKEQIKKINEKADEERRANFAGFGDLSQEERQTKLEELRPKMEESQKALAKQIDEVLMPNQRDRLKQVTIQIQGTAALSDDEVAKELALTDDQEKQIEQVRREAGERNREAFRDGGAGGDPEARRERFQKMQKETDDKVLAVLSSEQRDKFTKMQGEKFEFDRSQLFRGPGGPGGGGRGQRRGGGGNN
jgi:Spy/CpxP family protein refolding chaperone